MELANVFPLRINTDIRFCFVIGKKVSQIDLNSKYARICHFHAALPAMLMSLCRNTYCICMFAWFRGYVMTFLSIALCLDGFWTFLCVQTKKIGRFQWNQTHFYHLNIKSLLNKWQIYILRHLNFYIRLIKKSNKNIIFLPSRYRELTMTLAMKMSCVLFNAFC